MEESGVVVVNLGFYTLFTEIRVRSAFFIMEEGKVGNSDMRILVTFSFSFFI